MLFNDRKTILRYLENHLRVNGHIIGAASGSGHSALSAVKGGSDMILALSAGRFRSSGRPSFASYLCYGNSNHIVEEFTARELMTLLPYTPVLFGLNASDPLIDRREYIQGIKDSGLSGIVNFPSVALIDGNFRDALEADGMGFQSEVDAIRIAHDMDFFTLAFVCTGEQTKSMIEAGADVICAHLGLTPGGTLGPKKSSSLESAKKIADEVFAVCDEMAPNILKMVYSGPIKTPVDLQYFYENTPAQGFIGGSSFERIPSEKAILATTNAFKYPLDVGLNEKRVKSLEGVLHAGDYDYIEYVQEHIRTHYDQLITLQELALTLHVSAPYLSSLFRKKVGISFTEYLIRYRLNQACELLRSSELPISEVGLRVGYSDPVQFSKIFKKYKGLSPRNYKTTLLAQRHDGIPEA